MIEHRRPAAAARVLLAAGSSAATLALIAAMSATSSTSATDQSTADDRELRVVVTDPRIDADTAIAAARAAARAGQPKVTVPVGPAPRPASSELAHAAHTQTRSS